LVKISSQDREQEIIVDGQGLIGLEARAPDGTVLGRIMEVLTGEDEDGVTVVTHVVVESEGEYRELPLSSVDVGTRRQTSGPSSPTRSTRSPASTRARR
jgi:hypothetical protein